ncbi:MAG TPA: class I SAM-dependent methyltransferase [Planctomycetota bacterium]|nr:class I SAM-dependent methyltransferase [Planctomycetota bacterium]
MSAAPAPWWQAAFASAYRQVYAHRDDAAAAAEVAAIARRLGPTPGPVLDAGCGCGRHVAALADLGFGAVGIDWSADLLRAAAARPGGADVARGDLRRPPFADRSFAAVLSLFTAFGYGDDAENAALFARLAALIAPGGWFVLDLPDPARVRRTLVPESRRTTAAGLTIVEQRNLHGPRVQKQVRVSDGENHVAQWRECVRLYEPAEIDALARANGMAVVERWPGLRGAEVDEGRIVAWISSAAGCRD